MQKVTNKLRVVHYPQIPCEPFFVDVKDEEQALLVMNTLADQHLFLYDQNIIPDYSNILNVLMLEDNLDGDGLPGWTTYWNEDEVMDFDEFTQAYLIS